MTVNTCDGTHYTCGDVLEWKTGTSTSARLEQKRDNRTAFKLGATEIVVCEQKRSFVLEASTYLTAGDGAFVMSDGSGGYFYCGDWDEGRENSVSEDYETIETVAHFVDTRYNNGLFTETREHLTFSKSGTDKAQFNGAYSDVYYHKLVVTNAVIERTVTHFVVLGGVKIVLKTSTSTILPYTVDSPLILVYPNPSSHESPMDKDILEHGFYDYFGGGGWQVEMDGGDDYYYTDWMRLICTANAGTDAAKAATRYFEYFLGSGSLVRTSSASIPTVPVNTEPCCSVAQDKDGNVFYSVCLDGAVFYHLTDGDPVELTGLDGDNPKFYPIAPA